MSRSASLVRTFAVCVVAVPALSGCGGAEVTGSARDAAVSARDAAQRVAITETIAQVCSQVERSGALADARLDDAERTSLATLASVATRAGVPEQYTAPLRAAADPTAPGAAVQTAAAELKSACAG